MTSYISYAFHFTHIHIWDVFIFVDSSDEFLITTTCFDNHACLGIYHNKNPTCVGNWWHCEHTSVTLLSLSGSHIGREHEHYIWKNAYPCEGWYNCKQTFCCKDCRFRLSDEWHPCSKQQHLSQPVYLTDCYVNWTYNVRISWTLTVAY